jgi:hypothetical protein
LHQLDVIPVNVINKVSRKPNNIKGLPDLLVSKISLTRKNNIIIPDGSRKSIGAGTLILGASQSKSIGAI